MGKTAQKYLKLAIKAYVEVDGASEKGAFRDAITDIMHLAYRHRTNKDKDPYWIKDELSHEAHDVFMEELEANELKRIDKISRAGNLPLHTLDEFQFASGKDYFELKLKQGS